MDKTMTDLFELGRAFDALPEHVRGYCEPTEIGFKIHVATIVEARKVHAQRIIPWEHWDYAGLKLNPLTEALERAMAQLKQAAEDGPPR